MIYTQGDEAKYLYLLKKGEVKICKKVFLKHDAPQENVRELLEDPTLGRERPKNSTHHESKLHTVGVVSRGHILGMEDVILGK